MKLIFYIDSPYYSAFLAVFKYYSIYSILSDYNFLYISSSSFFILLILYAKVYLTFFIEFTTF
jgi:hypothetical protein